MGYEHWDNPFNVVIEFYLIQIGLDVELKIDFSSFDLSTDLEKHILYMNNIVIEVWDSLGIEISNDLLSEMHPVEELIKRKEKIEESKKQLIQILVGFGDFIILILILVFWL